MCFYTSEMHFCTFYRSVKNAIMHFLHGARGSEHFCIFYRSVKNAIMHFLHGARGSKHFGTFYRSVKNAIMHFLQIRKKCNNAFFTDP